MIIAHKLRRGCGRKSALSYITYANADITASTDPTTFSNVSIGAIKQDKYLVICACIFSTTDNGSISGVTVGGNAAALVVSSPVNDNYTGEASIYIIQAPNATTSDIVLSVTGAAVTTRSVVVYELVYSGNSYSSGVPLAYDTAANQGSTATRSADIDILTGGCAVGCAVTVNATDPAWTGLTKDVSFDSRSGEWVSGASVSDYESGGTVDVTATVSRLLAIASFT